MLADLRPEETLCCLLCRSVVSEKTVQAAREVIESGVDWEAFLKYAFRHKVFGFAYHHIAAALNDAVPSDIRLQLKASAVANAKKSEAMGKETASLLAFLADAGVKAVPYKGPVLVERIWGDGNLGAYYDLDIMVPLNALEPAQELLAGRGYAPVSRRTPNLPPGELEREAVPLAREHEIGFLLPLDLHTRPVPHWIGRPDRADRLWDDLQTVEFRGLRIRVLPDDWNLALLALHVHKHGYLSLHWAAGFYGFLRACPEVWPRALERANEIGARPEVEFARQVCDFVLDEPIAPINNRKRLVLRMAHQPFGQPPYPRKSLRLQMALRRRLGARFAYLFVPRPIDEGLVRLPSWLRPLHYLVRPIRLLVMYAIAPGASHVWMLLRRGFRLSHTTREKPNS